MDDRSVARSAVDLLGELAAETEAVLTRAASGS